MTVRELREKYLRFFESKGHSIYPSGSLIPFDVTGRLDESLLFNGAGMIQFKPYFRGVADPSNKRLTTAQKCVRTGDIESVGDLSHLTFFEMMGNFSFGDYFKPDAIAYSWEFLTSSEWLGLDPKRLSFTVFDNDDEAYREWCKWIASVGLDPIHRVFRLGEETNYWPAGAFSSGPPGPCGPNSEMFYWVADSEPPTGPYTVEDWLRDDEAKNWLEIWNDVFIQFEWQGALRNPDRPADGYAKTGMPDLPFKSIDTGMGLERTAAVLSGKSSVYDTDAFALIIDKIVSLSRRAGKGYEAYKTDPLKDVAVRIIADHIRTACFCIADGILPGNSGRGYVLRRLIRRAVLKGQRALGFAEPFFHEVFDGVVASMGDHYTELQERKDVIVETLRNEEALFRRTLLQGESLLVDELHQLRAHLDQMQRVASLSTDTHAVVRESFPGEIAFRLYDTYGFPLEVTQELVEEAGFRVDVEGYESAMLEAQERSRGSQDRATVYGGVESGLDVSQATRFLGYDALEATATVLAIQSAPEGSAFVVAVDRTPFYAASGGQISDIGMIEAAGFAGTITDVTKREGVFLHVVQPMTDDATIAVGTQVHLTVDIKRRAMIRRNHTATHLLQAALRRVLGSHVTQAGSYVGPDNLRFDFTHGKGLTETEKAEVERIVNEEVLANTPVVTHVDLPIAEAKARGAMALFGEKYGDKVRMVEVGEFSRELCGGTHVASTGEIGLFKIVAEASAASGVRRIEALTGEGSYAWALDQTRLLHEAAALLKASPDILPAAIERTLESLREERRKRERAEMIAVGGKGQTVDAPVEILGVRLLVKDFGEVDPKIAATALDNAVAADPGLIAVSAVVSGGKIQFTAKAGASAIEAGAHAGNLVREIAKIAGGGGGGRPEFATAGGKDPEKVSEALAATPAALEAMLTKGR